MNENSSERHNKRKLQKDIENCVHVLQEGIDTEAAESISVFSNNTTANHKHSDKLSDEYRLKTEDELDELEALKNWYLKDLDILEDKIENLEKLCDEVEELEKELEVKTKLNRNRKSRLFEQSPNI